MKNLNFSSPGLLIATALIAMVVALAVYFILRPQAFKMIWTRIGAFLARGVERRYYKRFRKQYPQLAERFAGYGAPTPQKQEALMNAFKRLPPMEAKKLHDEFQRLRINFTQRHPEVEDLMNVAQGGKPQDQLKAMEKLLNLPEEKRKSIEKDFLWAWDQLRNRFPSLVGSLESAYKKG